MISSRRRIRPKAWLTIHKAVSFGAENDKSAYTGSHGFRVRLRAGRTVSTPGMRGGEGRHQAMRRTFSLTSNCVEMIRYILPSRRVQDTYNSSSGDEWFGSKKAVSMLVATLVGLADTHMYLSKNMVIQTSMHGKQGSALYLEHSPGDHTRKRLEKSR